MVDMQALTESVGLNFFLTGNLLTGLLECEF